MGSVPLGRVLPTPTDGGARDLYSCVDGWPFKNSSGCDRREWPRLGGADKNEFASSSLSATDAMFKGSSPKLRSLLRPHAPEFPVATSDWDLARISAMQVRISRISLVEVVDSGSLVARPEVP